MTSCNSTVWVDLKDVVAEVEVAISGIDGDGSFMATAYTRDDKLNRKGPTRLEALMSVLSAISVEMANESH